MRLFVNRHDTKCGGRIPTNSLQIVANFLTGFDECCLITIDTGTEERELWAIHNISSSHGELLMNPNQLSAHVKNIANVSSQLEIKSHVIIRQINVTYILSRLPTICPSSEL